MKIELTKMERKVLITTCKSEFTQIFKEWLDRICHDETVDEDEEKYEKVLDTLISIIENTNDEGDCQS